MRSLTQLFFFCLIISLPEISGALTFKSGEKKQFHQNNLEVAKLTPDTVDGRCSHSLPMPSATSPVKFDISGFRHIEAFDLPEYVSFSFGKIWTKKSDGAIAPEIKAIADLNNDGRDDLILDYFENPIPPIVLFANEDGTFRQANVDVKAGRRHIRNGEAADINNDGLIDFVGFTTGDPGWSWEDRGHSTGGKEIPKGDANLLLINQGEEFVNYPIPDIRLNDWTHGGSLGDLNNDGLIDILPLSEDAGAASFPLRNMSNSVFSIEGSEYSREVTHFQTSDLDTGDFNNDGLLDIAVAVSPNLSGPSKLGTVRVIYGDGDFDFEDNKKINFGSSWITSDNINEWKKYATKPRQPGQAHEEGTVLIGSSHIEVLDLNGDAKDDVLLGHWLSSTGNWKTAGFTAYLSMDDCFADATRELFPNQENNRLLLEEKAVNYSHNFFLTDINHDGLKDLVIQSDDVNAKWYAEQPNSGHPYLFINQGGYWLPIKGSDVEPWIFVDDIVPGDFNGDGLTDLAYIRQHGLNAVLHVSLAEMSLEKRAIDTDPMRDRFSGKYLAEWFVESLKTPGEWEKGATDTLLLENGRGNLTRRDFGTPGSSKQRESLSIIYDGEQGDIEMFGSLGLYNNTENYPTRIGGRLIEKQLNATWHWGQRVKVTLTKFTDVDLKVQSKKNFTEKDGLAESQKSTEASINFDDLKVEFYGLGEFDDFMKFNGSINDFVKAQAGIGELKFGLMFDFKGPQSKARKRAKDYKIAVRVEGFDAISDIEVVRECEGSFWEDNGEIKEIYIHMKRYDEDACIFKVLPNQAVSILKWLASNMPNLISDARYKDPQWSDWVTKLSARFN